MSDDLIPEVVSFISGKKNYTHVLNVPRQKSAPG